jgi:Flp pilus assembly protein TadG
MVTAELAACLPVLVLILGVALSAVSVVAARVRVQDAAREAARAAARGDPAAALRLAHEAAPGARLQLMTGAVEVVADVRAVVHPLGGWLPAVTVAERAVAAVEPTGASP